MFTCVVSTLAQSCVQHFSWYWMNSVDSVQAEFSRGLLSQNVSICPGVVSSTSGMDLQVFVVLSCVSTSFHLLWCTFAWASWSCRHKHSFCLRSSALSLHHFLHPLSKKNGTSFSKVTQRIEPLFLKWPSLKYYRRNRTSFSKVN